METLTQTNNELEKEISYLINHYNYSEIKECLESMIDEINIQCDIDIRKTKFE